MKMQRKRPRKKQRCSPVTSKQCALFLGLFEVERILMLDFSCVIWRLWTPTAGFYQSQMHLHRYCLCDRPPSHWEWAPRVNINPGRSMCLGMQGLTGANQTINMDFQMHLLGFSCQTPFMPPHKGLFVALSSPRKASQLQTFPIYQEIKQSGSGWAVGKPGTGSSPSSRELPPPKALPQPQPAGFVVVSAELPPLAELSCAPAQALQPSPASFCWSQADVLTCEQLLLKNRYPPFQRAKSLGQLGKTGKGHRLNLFLLCAPCGASHEGAGGWRWGLGAQAGAFAC